MQASTFFIAAPPPLHPNEYHVLCLSAPIVRLVAFSMRGVMSSLVPLDDAACDAREGVTSDGGAQ